jgi:hypothetical protein
LGGYASWPRQADLRGFEPAEIARLETAMWRDYYEKRYVALFGHLHELSRALRRWTASESRWPRLLADAKKPRTMPGLLNC